MCQLVLSLSCICPGVGTLLALLLQPPTERTVFLERNHQRSFGGGDDDGEQWAASNGDWPIWCHAFRHGGLSQRLHQATAAAFPEVLGLSPKEACLRAYRGRGVIMLARWASSARLLQPLLMTTEALEMRDEV